MYKKMIRWEEEYEKWTTGMYDTKYNELKQKIDSKNEKFVKNLNPKDINKDNANSTIEMIDISQRKMTKEEYSNYKKMSAIKENLSKVKNIMEYRDKLNHEREIIEGEIKRRQEARNLNKEKEDLEKENADLLLEMDEINSKLKQKDLSEEDRKKLENDKKQNIEKRNKNNEKFLDNQQKMENNLFGDNKYMAKIADEELEEEKIIRSTKISKCNMACNNLMQGKSWEAIEVKLDNWENYKGKKGQVDKLKNSIEKDNALKENVSQDKDEQNEKQVDQEKEENLPVVYKSFSEKHPILAKIPFLAKIADKLNKKKNIQIKENKDREENNDLKDMESKIAEEVGKIIDENNKENIEKNENNEFKNYLKEIADKGMDGIKKEKLEKAKETLAHNKINSANKSAEKYGGRYNEQDGASKDEGPEL